MSTRLILITLILLVCLVVSPFLLKLPTVNAQSITLSQTGEFAFPDNSAGIQRLVAHGNYLYLIGAKDENEYLEILKTDDSGNVLANFTSDALRGESQNPLIIGNDLIMMTFQYNATTEGQQPVILELQLSDLTLVGSYSDPNGNTWFDGMATDGSYIYIIIYTQPSDLYYVEKIAPSTMTLVTSSIAFDSYMGTLACADGVVYTYSYSGTLYAFNPNNLSLTSSTDFSNAINYDFQYISSIRDCYATLWGEYGTILYQYNTNAVLTGSWNESAIGAGQGDGDDLAYCECQGYLVLGMDPDQPLISVSVINQASMTSLAYASAPNDCNGGAFAICAYGNYIYAAFFNSETDVPEIAQYELTTGSSPTPTPGGGGGSPLGGVLPGYPFPLTSPSPLPTQSNQSSPSPTQSHLNSGILLLIIALIAVAVAITLALSRPRKHRKH
jgi:hypothetical protein